MEYQKFENFHHVQYQRMSVVTFREFKYGQHPVNRMPVNSNIRYLERILISPG